MYGNKLIPITSNVFFFIFAWWIIFILPFYIPINELAVSSAHDYGFNNSAAIIGAILVILIGILISHFGLIGFRNNSFSSLFDNTANYKTRIPLIHLASIFLFNLLIILGLYWLTGEERSTFEAAIFSR